MRILGMGLVAALAMVSPAKAEQWRAAAENEQHPMTLMFIDAASVKLSGTFATGWVLTVLEDDTSGERDWNHSVILRKIDCSGKQSMMVHSKFFMNDNLLEDNDTPGDWLPIRAGSMIEGVADIMCGRGEYLTDAVADPIALSKAYFAEVK
jgi:hypothetical protein